MFKKYLIFLLSFPILFILNTNLVYAEWKLNPHTVKLDYYEPTSSSNLDDLADVNAPTPSDNQALTWDATTSKWIPEIISGSNNWTMSADSGIDQLIGDIVETVSLKGGTGISTTVGATNTWTVIASLGTDIVASEMADADHGDVSWTGGVATVENLQCTDCVALGTETTGNYAASDAEAGSASSGDTATGFFSAGTIEVNYGGTGRSSWTLYDIPYASGTTTLVGIPIGTAAQVLAVNADANGYKWKLGTYDAIVAASGGDYTTIQAAIDAGVRSIFVRSGTYTGTVTIAANATVERIEGETNLSSISTGNWTIKKSSVQIGYMVFNDGAAAATVVTIWTSAAKVEFFKCVWKGTTYRSGIDVGTAANDLSLAFCRANGNPAGQIWLNFTGLAARPKIANCTITGYSGAASILDDGGLAIDDGLLLQNVFLNNSNTVFLVDIANTNRWIVAGNAFRQFDKGAVDIQSGVVTGNNFDGVTVGVDATQVAIKGDGQFVNNYISNMFLGAEVVGRTTGGALVSTNTFFGDYASTIGLKQDSSDPVIIAEGNFFFGCITDIDQSATHSTLSIIVGNALVGGVVTNRKTVDIIFGNYGQTGVSGDVFTPIADNEVNLGSASLAFKTLYAYDYIFKRAGLVLVNGNNNNVATTTGNYQRITGPTAAFSITGLANGADGRILILQNATAQTMTIANQNTSSLVANRVITTLSYTALPYVPSEGDVVIGSEGSAILIYNSTDSRWILLGVFGGKYEKIFSKAVNYVARSDDYAITMDATDGVRTLTLPSAANRGQKIYVVKIDSSVNAVTVQRAGTDTIEGATSITLASQYDSAELIADGTSTWYRIDT